MFWSWSVIVSLLGAFIVVIAAGLRGYITPWDEWDAEGFDQRPEVIRAQRQLRVLSRCGVFIVVAGLIGLAIAAR